jgi:hypothetical protein
VRVTFKVDGSTFEIPDPLTFEQLAEREAERNTPPGEGPTHDFWEYHIPEELRATLIRRGWWEEQRTNICELHSPGLGYPGDDEGLPLVWVRFNPDRSVTVDLDPDEQHEFRDPADGIAFALDLYRIARKHFSKENARAHAEP